MITAAENGMDKRTYRTDTSRLKGHGALLYALYEWSGMKQDEFAVSFGKKKNWFLKAVKWEIIPDQEKYAICRAFPEVTLEYFDGKLKLPLHRNVPIANEPAVAYGKAAENEALRKENSDLKDQIIELQKKMIAAKDEIIDLKETIINMR